MEFKFPKIPLTPETFGRLLTSVKNSVEKYDYDSGWVATPTDKIFKHELNVLPCCVLVYASDASNGEPADLDTFTGLTKTQLTIGGPKAFARVLINK